MAFLHIELVNLAPNSILMVVVFMHLCEAFIRMLPKLDLFCLFYEQRTRNVTWCANFHLRGGSRAKYLPFKVKDTWMP